MKVSIITASYNCENTIKETIESIQNQTHKDWELIIVDDGSADNSINVIEEYCKNDTRIKLYTHNNHQNKGLKKTLQLAISKCNCEWIHFVECDDILTPDSIEKKLDIIKQYPEVSLIFSEVELFGNDEAIKELTPYINERKEVLSKESYPSKVIAKSPILNLVPTFSCVMCKKECLQSCSFKSPIDAYLDWFLWSQMSKCNVYYINEKLTKWRISPNSYANIFKERADKYKIKKYRLKIKQNIKHQPVIIYAVKKFLIILSGILSKIFPKNNKKI